MVKVGGIVHEVVKVLLRHPKEERLSAGVTIDLFQITGEASWLCPVKAYKKWREQKCNKLSTMLPLLRLGSGENYTGSNFNRDLRKFLGDVAQDLRGSVSSHSFRCGIATAAGYSDQG